MLLLLTFLMCLQNNYHASEAGLFLRIVKDLYDNNNKEEEENRQAFIGEDHYEISNFFQNFSKWESYYLLIIE